jgi:hypothetical protein
MWEYTTAYCYFESNCKQCKDKQGKNLSRHWVLSVGDNEHHWLQPGLNALGKLGWELVAVQLAGDSSTPANPPPHFYVFKRQVTG